MEESDEKANSWTGWEWCWMAKGFVEVLTVSTKTGEFWAAEGEVARKLRGSAWEDRSWVE